MSLFQNDLCLPKTLAGFPPAEKAKTRCRDSRTMTPEQIESFAIRLALGNTNGGTWKEVRDANGIVVLNYTEAQKEHWRQFVMDLAADIYKLGYKDGWDVGNRSAGGVGGHNQLRPIETERDAVDVMNEHYRKQKSDTEVAES